MHSDEHHSFKQCAKDSDRATKKQIATNQANGAYE